MSNRHAQKGLSPAKKIIISITLLVIGLIGWIAYARLAENWVTVSTNLYNVKIPDGWTVYHGNGSDSIVDADCVSCLIYKPGRNAEIMTGTPTLVSKARLNPFLITPQADATEADFFLHYDKTGTVPVPNAIANKYYKKITEAREMGFSPGTELYGYAVTRGDNTIFIRYAAFPNRKNQQEVVDKLVSTLELK